MTERSFRTVLVRPCGSLAQACAALVWLVVLGVGVVGTVVRSHRAS